MPDEPTGLPRGWAIAKVEELRAHDAPIVYGILQPGPNQPDGVPYVRPTEIVRDVIATSRLRRTTHEIAKKYERSKLAPRDVLISIVGTIGKVAMVPAELSGANITQSSARIRPHEQLIGPQYLRFGLKAPQLVSQYDAARLGTGVPRLNIAHVRALQVPVAPLPEQERIVSKIEVLQARSDAAKEALDVIPPLLEKFRKSVLAAAFRGDLTKDWRDAHPDVEPASALLDRIRAERRRLWEATYPRKKYKVPAPVDKNALPTLPSGWCWASADELTRGDAPIVYGIIQPGPHVEDGIPFVRPADITGGQVTLAKLPRTSPEIASKYARAALRPGDLVFSIVGTIGKWLFVPEALDGANITQSSVRIRAAAPYDAEFILRAFQSPQVARQMALMMFGNAVQRLNVAHVRQLAIPLPPIPEWVAMRSLLRQALSVVDVQAAKAHHIAASLDALNQSILAKAFRGELVPQDPNDEPASALLERIRAAREAVAPKKGRRRKG